MTIQTLSQVDAGSAIQGLSVDPAAGRRLYADHARQWLDRIGNVSSIVKAGYEGFLTSRVIPEFGSVELNRIDSASIRRWMSSMHAQGLSPSHIRQAAGVLRASLGKAVADGLIPSNPATGILTSETV